MVGSAAEGAIPSSSLQAANDMTAKIPASIVNNLLFMVFGVLMFVVSYFL